MAEIKEILSYQGKTVFPKGSSLNVRHLPSVKKGKILFNVKRGKSVGTATGGFVFFSNDKVGSKNVWSQIFLPKKYNGKNTGYVRTDVVGFDIVEEAGGDVTGNDSKTVIRGLVKNDVLIYKRLLVISEVLERSERLNVNIGSSKELLSQLTNRYEARQKSLRKNKAVETIDFFDNVYSWLKNKFGLSGIYNIGAVQFIPIAVGAVAGIVASVALYYMFKPKYDESQRDLKITGCFKEFLNKLPEDKKNKITEDLEKQIDDAYNVGLTEGKFGSLFSTLKYVLIAGGGFVLISKLPDLINKTKNSKKGE
ncbi:MAG: hypothetical protein KAT68_00700 [Bacteroidales bacterium]|nr:hypothetical protein [Bacteroidales bacterium]